MSSQTTLDTFKEILADISDMCTTMESDPVAVSVGFKIFSQIKKNPTMSDWASTEKKHLTLC